LSWRLTNSHQELNTNLRKEVTQFSRTYNFSNRGHNSQYNNIMRYAIVPEVSFKAGAAVVGALSQVSVPEYEREET